MAKQTWTTASATQGNAANAPEVYTTQYQYDTWNRLLKMTYPDGEVLTYGYDSGGLVTAAKGVKSNYTYDYLSRLDYDKFEQRAWLEAGNQVRTAYSYHPQNRRLCGLVSGKGTPSTGCSPPRRPTARGPYASSPSKRRSYNLTLAYDSIHNILSKQQTDVVAQPSGMPITQKKTSYHWLYAYAQKPHAPPHIGDRTYSYDDK